MQRPRRDATLAERMQRIRTRAGGRPVAPSGASTRRRVSRREQERRRQQLVNWGIAGAAALILLILVGGALNEYVLRPRQVLATVGEAEIRRSDYWKARAVGLIEEANQFQQFANSGFVPPDQQQQYLQIATQRLQEVGGVWGSTEVDEPTLREMIDDQVYLQRMGELGLQMTDAEVEEFILQGFAPTEAPLVTPTPTATFIPARAALATEAAATGTSPADEATPVASPPALAVGSPTENAATPVSSLPAGTPSASPVASPALGPEQARATAEAAYAEFQDSVFAAARLNREDYERLVARPAVARENVEGALAAAVGQSAEQVRAAHILVETREQAEELARRLAAGEDFAALASEASIDEGTAGNGGDLGWFAREEVVEPFAEAAFALEPGGTSAPFETEFGWHIVRSFERAADRPLTSEQIATIEEARVERWLAEQRAALAIEADLEPTPTTTPATFQPPVEAPPPPAPALSPVASPVAGVAAAATPMAP